MNPRGVQRIAAVLLGLDKEVAARLLQGLPDDPLQRITQAMLELSDQKFRLNDAEPCLEEFYTRISDGNAIVNDFQDLLQRALGQERAGSHVSRLAASRRLANPFAPLESLPAKEVADVLQEENDQVCALVLAGLKSFAAARILELLPADRRAGVLQRIASTVSPPMSVLEDIAASLLQRFGPVAPSFAISDENNVLTAANIMNFVDQEVEKEINEKLQDQDQGLFTAIDESRITMEDLITIDKKSMQKVLTGIDARVLTVALKGVSREIERSILDNVSKRSRDNIIEERELLGPMPVAEVLVARKELLSAVRSMVKSGDVILRRSGGDDIVE